MLTLDLANQIDTPNKCNRVKIVAINDTDDSVAIVFFHVMGGGGKIFRSDLSVRIYEGEVEKLVLDPNFVNIHDIARVVPHQPNPNATPPVLPITGALSGLRAAMDAAARANDGKKKAAETYLASIGVFPGGTVA